MDCLGCPELTLDDWARGLLAQLQGRRYPLSGSLELTERCNLACVHCYISQRADCHAAAARELTLTQIDGLLAQMAEAGSLNLLLTGGEVLLRPDFLDIYRVAKQHGLLVSVFTNGTLLTPRIADYLAEWRPSSVEITLYGATQETYEQVTQVPGSYARCMRGIELALDRKLPLYLKSVLLTVNHHELEQMRALAAAVGIHFRFDGLLWPRLDGGQQPCTYRLSVQELIALDRAEPQRQREWQELAQVTTGQLVRAEYVYGCGAGFRSFHVDSAGRLSMCMMARRPAYELLPGSFQEGWQFLGTLRGEKRKLDTACRTCVVGSLCTQCPGWSQSVHGDDETPVAFVCQLGSLRAALINSPVASAER